MKCEICQTENPNWSWTDTHGVAQCFTCGTPYQVYHYEGDKRVDKPPELCVLPEYIPVLQAYWLENKRRIPGGHSFPGGQELASQDDRTAFSLWMKLNAPKQATP